MPNEEKKVNDWRDQFRMFYTEQDKGSAAWRVGPMTVEVFIEGVREEAYAEGLAKGQHDERLEIEKLKLDLIEIERMHLHDTGYRNGVEAAKECIGKFKCPSDCKRDTMDHDGFRTGIDKCYEALDELLKK